MLALKLKGEYVLTTKMLNNTIEFAKEEIVNKANKHGETNQMFIARCWIEGYLRALNKEGYSLCLKRGTEEYSASLSD